MLRPETYRKVFGRLGAFVESKPEDIDIEDILSKIEEIAPSKTGQKQPPLRSCCFILYIK